MSLSLQALRARASNAATSAFSRRVKHPRLSCVQCHRPVILCKVANPRLIHDWSWKVVLRPLNRCAILQQPWGGAGNDSFFFQERADQGTLSQSKGSFPLICFVGVGFACLFSWTVDPFFGQHCSMQMALACPNPSLSTSCLQVAHFGQRSFVRPLISPPLLPPLRQQILGFGESALSFCSPCL